MTTTLTSPASSSPIDLEGKGQPIVDKTFRWILFLCLAVGIVFLAVLLVYVTIKGWPRLTPTLWENMPSIRRPEQAGAQSAITGTLWVIGFTALFA
ncbi:MAG: phosphate ABC transporter, permease protein PstA, partial [Candidatus Nanopelagicales bacterium]